MFAKCSLLFFIILFFPCSAFAGKWGLGMEFGEWPMDTRDFKKEVKYYNASLSPSWRYKYKLDRERSVGELYFYYETDLRPNAVFGFSFGAGDMPSVQYKYRGVYNDANGGISVDSDIRNETVYVPMRIYGKLSRGRLGFMAAAGADFLMLETKVAIDKVGYGVYSATDQELRGTFEAEKFVPNVAMGLEYALSKTISFGFGGKYRFMGKVKGLQGDVVDPAGIWNGSGRYTLIMVSDPPYGEYFTGKRASCAGLPNEREFGYDFSGWQMNFDVKFYFGN